MIPRKALLSAVRSEGWGIAHYRSSESRQRIFQLIVEDGNCHVLFHVSFGERGPEDLEIGWLSVYPPYQRGKGFGGHYLEAFLDLARAAGFASIRATEVLSGTEEFWGKYRFVPDPESDFGNDYIFRPADE